MERQAVILMTHGGSLVHSKAAELPDVAFSLATGAHSDQAESPEHLAEVSCRVSGGGPGSVDLQQGQIGPFVPATRNELRHRPGRHDVSYPSSMRQDLLEACPGEFGRSEHRDIPAVVVWGLEHDGQSPPMNRPVPVLAHPTLGRSSWGDYTLRAFGRHGSTVSPAEGEVTGVVEERCVPYNRQESSRKDYPPYHPGGAR